MDTELKELPLEIEHDQLHDSSSKPRSNRSLIIILCFIGILFFLGIFSQFVAKKDIKYRSNFSNIPSINPTPSQINKTANTVALDNNTTISFNVEPILRYELIIGASSLEQLVKKGWDGNLEKPLPLSFDELNPGLIQSFMDLEEKRRQKFTIPNSLASVYLDYKEAKQIQDFILELYDEYVAYLKNKGVHNRFIEEFTTTTLPRTSERLKFYSFNQPNKGSFQEVFIENGKTNYRKTTIRFYVSDVYAYSLQLVKSQLFGTEPQDPEMGLAYWKKIRDMSLRMLVYHELTHALQVAYIYQTTPSAPTNTNDYWKSSSSILADAAKPYFWDWNFSSVFGGSRDFNRTLGDESTAEGVSWEMLNSFYNLDPTKQDILWNYSFAGENMSDVQKQLGIIKNILQNKYNGMYIGDYGTELEKIIKNKTSDKDLEKFALTNITDRLKNQRVVAAGIGYSHPIRGKEMEVFWDMLR